MHSVSRQSARKLVSSWMSEESTNNFPAYGIDSSQNALVVSMVGTGVLAGVPFVDALVEHMDCYIEWHVKEGETLSSGENKIATITGTPADLVHGELLTKNLLSRASSIATFASRLKKLLKEFSWKGELVSPFTHTPGFTLVEENAVFVAGIPSSRNPSSVLLPQSHIKAVGSVKEAISAIKLKTGKNTQVTVECSAFQEAKDAAEAGATCVRFDSITAKDLGSFSNQLKSISSCLLVEASANFDETTIRQYALPNVDSITTKKLFNGYPPLEFKVNFEASAKPLTQKRAAASAESEHPSSTDNGVTNEKEHESGSDNDLESAKRIKLEPATPKVSVKQTKTDAPQPSLTTDLKTFSSPGATKAPVSTPAAQKKSAEKFNGNNRTNANLNKNKQQQQQAKNQRLNNRQQQQQQNQSGRGGGPQQRRNESRMPMNSAAGLIDAVGRQMGQMGPMRSHQNSQQQAASAFLQQARMMNSGFNAAANQARPNAANIAAAAAAALLSAQQRQRQHPQPPQGFRGGSGGGPMMLPRGGDGPMGRGGNQWSIMGGPPPPPHPRGGGGGFFPPCRMCGAQLAPGMPFCRNCRAPAR